jgi:putative ABC transport system permease protein
MSAFQLALKNISGNAFRNFVVALCATLVSAFVLFTAVIMRGAESSLRLTIDRLGADVIVVPLGSQDTVESALLMGVPARVWMPKKDNLEKIAAIPGVEVVTPQMFLVTLPTFPVPYLHVYDCLRSGNRLYHWALFKQK